MSLAVSVAASIKLRYIYAASMRSSMMGVADREKGPLRAKRNFLALSP